MSGKLISYELSEEADFDLSQIFDYTEKEHGFNQAVLYLTNIEAVFQSLVASPFIGRTRNEIKQELFSITEQEHTIFYRINENYIRIVRVLHGRKDIPKLFSFS